MPLAIQVLLALLPSAPFSLLEGWNAIATARLEARLQAIRDAGDPVTMADLAKRHPDPPPGKNAAPVFQAAFERMEAREQENAAQEERLPLVGQAQLPGLDEPLPPPMRGAIQAYLKGNHEVLALLHQAAALAECKFDLDFAQGPGMLMPHLSKLRGAARLLALEAIERTEAGQADEAAASLTACLRMGEAVRQEPVLISTLVRIACDAIAVAAAERWASGARPSPEALARVEAAFAAAGDRSIIEHAMVGERCFGIDIYQTYVLKPGGARLAAELGVEMPLGAQVLWNAIPAAYFKSDMAHYLDIMSDYVAASRMAPPEWARAAARAGRNLEERIPRYYVVARLILPALQRVFQTGQEHLARCDSARTALAALRYRARQRRLPETLEALVPDYLAAVPADPFDGKPLRYRTDGAGLAVYAVGPDGKDDGGDTERREAKAPDIGFRIRWPRTQF